MDTAIVGLIAIGVNLLLAGANATFFAVIKFNDMIHLGREVKELSNSIKDLVKLVEKNDKDIAVMQGVCKEKHKNL